MSDWLIVGLGNPGQNYDKTRHNIGWMLVDVLCTRWNTSLQARSREKCLLAAARQGEHKVWLCKPTTFMNLSGEAVQPLMAYYQIPQTQLLVISDDVHLDFGRARLRAKGSSGGQKGIQSIIQRLGHDQFARLRLGVGPFPQGRDMAGFVLERFPKPQLEALPELLDCMAGAIENWISLGTEAVIPTINGYRLTQT